jgi:predicted small integral membrane protein
MLTTTDALYYSSQKLLKKQQTVWTELSPEEQEQIEIKIQEDNRGDQLNIKNKYITITNPKLLI